MNAQRWPLDFDALNKGDTIPAERLEQIVGLIRMDRRYSLKVMALGERIRRELRKKGRLVTVAYIKDDLRILTDAEASQYNHEAIQSAAHALLRRHGQLLAVDPKNLTDKQAEKHERFVEVDGRMTQALIASRRTPKLESAKRNTPGLPAKT